MNTKKIVLKKSPPLEFLFNEKSFQVTNGADSDTQGIYQYDDLKSIEYDKEKTNWLLTVLSYIVELVAGVGGGSTYKSKKRLTINLSDKKIMLDLLDCEQKTIDELIVKLERVIKTST
nr:hypothetical protein [Allomuricauda sp.]